MLELPQQTLHAVAVEVIWSCESQMTVLEIKPSGKRISYDNRYSRYASNHLTFPSNLFETTASFRDFRIESNIRELPNITGGGVRCNLIS